MRERQPGDALGALLDTFSLPTAPAPLNNQTVARSVDDLVAEMLGISRHTVYLHIRNRKADLATITARPWAS